ncbi:MAG TPA: rcc01693 family protein [Beijerinckiaceae bacterium]
MTSAPPPFPWEEAMAFGFGVLRLSADHFWALTPRELAAAARGHAGPRPAAPTRAALGALMRAFPDEARR